ncbi:LysR family transcriptional regulator [Rhizosaccharibacter radicis]|uniref:LysR family transcriptional regulator n=1 Tax=Rhizosaccharibacter radicis TaxID=2782605 RepID=A0ABT1VVD2_9PROT|nr:LysR family transcriptional regulator [Acetobacteraceae bacterium KSS12]
MRDQLTALRVFVLLARSGSFSGAAKTLGVSQATASRMIASLEQHLGVTLVTRSTRAVVLTERGRNYLSAIEPVLAALDHAGQAAVETSRLTGTLRIGLAAANAINQVIPHLNDFMAAHPDLSVSLISDDRRQDLILEQVDVALRFGKLPDTGMRARRIGSWPLVVAASPAYLDAHSAIRHPEDLVDHDFVVAGPIVGRRMQITRDGDSRTFEVRGRLSVTSSEVAVAAVRQGLGLGAASTSALGNDLAAGRLVRLLPDWQIGDLEAHALFPGSQPPQRAARLFVDHLVAALRQAS